MHYSSVIIPISFPSFQCHFSVFSCLLILNLGTLSFIIYYPKRSYIALVNMVKFAVTVTIFWHETVLQKHLSYTFSEIQNRVASWCTIFGCINKRYLNRAQRTTQCAMLFQKRSTASLISTFLSCKFSATFQDGR